MMAQPAVGIRVLPEEVWLKIISCLDLRSKLRVACTDTFLRRIVQDSSLWIKVNLTNRAIARDDRCVSPESINASNKWSFPADEDKVMLLARSYFGDKLKVLHLHVVNTDILKYLYNTCVSLESMVLYHDKMALKNTDLSFLSPNLKMLDLCLKGCFNPRSRRQTPCNFAVVPFKELRSLTIRYTELSPSLFNILCSCSGLNELVLHHCSNLTPYGFTQLAENVPGLTSLWLRYCSGISGYLQHLANTMYAIPEIFTNLRILKLQCITKNMTNAPYDADVNMLNGLISLPDLRSLWLENVDIFSPEHLITLSSNLTELRELELVDDSNVTTEVLVSVSTHMPHLNRLVLKDSKNVTDVGMRSLANHTTLTYLNVRGCSVSYEAICDTVITMKELQVLVLGKDTSDEFCLCMETLKERVPNLTVHAVMGP